ncbi:MAG: aldehyde dehydrogenase family protein [Deltaproteobacteria bacterium]|nr:aldehyde dehydrogenase family protein [Deltaproteobacteria bacterium]
MADAPIPAQIPNWINGQEEPAQGGGWVAKMDPHTGQRQSWLARSGAPDVDAAVAAARAAQPAWADTTPVARGEILHRMAQGLLDRQEEIAAIVAAETGKTPGEARGETGGAASLGRFYAGEGQRLYARTTTSGVPGRQALTIRVPAGVAGLIIAANTPIANVAWKVFPALICGNGVVLKAAEDTPATAWIVGRLAQEAGLPDGLLNIVQGLGEEAGAPLVRHSGVEVVSFTGSAEVGRDVARACGERLKKCSLELGGKNPLVVCDDADLANAVKWTALSAFSNAGQRCAAASRVIVFEAVYEEFTGLLLDHIAGLRLGPHDGDDLGPVINQSQLNNMLAALGQARQEGARVLAGGERLTGPAHAAGYYLAPTVLEGAAPQSFIARSELFGPIALLFRVQDYAAALALANDSPYGLTASIHTTNLHRALDFTRRVQAGVATVNGGTYGSEPHMPFGGVKASGNGWREPGTEALDIYSELKDVYLHLDAGRL